MPPRKDLSLAKTAPSEGRDGAGEGASDRTRDDALAKTEGSPAKAALAAARAAREKAQRRRQERSSEARADHALVQRAKEGDSAAFRTLVEANQGRLFAVAFGMLRDRDDAMDVVQDAFIKAHRKLVDFEGNAAFSTWLYRICVNLCIDRKRTQARRRSVDLEEVGPGELSEDTLYAGADITPKLSGQNPLRNASDKELGAEIQRALGALSEDHRAALVLREVEGLSYEEIADALEIPRGTVMSRLFHARRNMQKMLRPFLGLQEGDGLSRDSSENQRDTSDPGEGSKGRSAARSGEDGGAS